MCCVNFHDMHEIFDPEFDKVSVTVDTCFTGANRKMLMFNYDFPILLVDL